MRNFSTDNVALNNWKKNYFLLHVDLQANYHASHSIPNSNPWQPSIKQPSSAQNTGGGPLEWAAIATDWNLKAHTHTNSKNKNKKEKKKEGKLLGRLRPNRTLFGMFIGSFAVPTQVEE